MLKAVTMNHALPIGSPKAAQVFEHPQSRRILLALAASEQSLQELARATGLSLSLLHYHVGRLTTLGLVEAASEERRAGRPIKRYRAVSAAFFVPAALESQTGVAALARDLRAALDDDRARRDDVGTVYSVDADGRSRMRRVVDARAGGAFEAWIMLELSAPAADALQSELRAVFARYAQPGDGKSRPYLIYCGFAERIRAAGSTKN
jgi:DNA-binding transcriptional ArsR family regulator